MGAKTSQQMLDAAAHIIAQHDTGNQITVYACAKKYDVTPHGLNHHLRKIGRADLIRPHNFAGNTR